MPRPPLWGVPLARGRVDLKDKAMARDRDKPVKSTVKGKEADEPRVRRRAAASAEGDGAGRLAELEKALGYRFAEPALLELALTHRSHPYEARAEMDGASGAVLVHEAKNAPGTDNEQLEFVGDAVLGLAITELLFQEFPKQTEGELTRMRASLVSRQRMAEFGGELGLGEHLLLGPSAEQNGARRKPALLANAAEAVFAAMYLDANRRGKDGLAVVRKLVEQKLLRPELAALRAALTKDGGRGALRDAKTVLQERVQAEGAGRLRYADTDQTGPAHQRRFTVEARLEAPNGTMMVLASAEGSSKKEAQQRAAELALKGWGRLRLKEEDAEVDTIGETATSEDAA
jgi:ribonuclease III